MIFNEIYRILTVIANDKFIRSSAIIITSFAVTLTLFVSYFAGILIFSSYLFGYLVCWCLLKYQPTASTYLLGLITFCYGPNPCNKKLKQSCSICEDLSCKRHQHSKSAAPWKDLYINRELDTSVENFYNKILDNFVTSWYRLFTNDEDFVDELRYCLKYATASAINRFLEINHANVISTKLLPYIFNHIERYFHIQQMQKLKNAPFDEMVIKLLPQRLHPATTNRKNELCYLQHLSSSLMPFILPEKYLQCKNYSVLVREILAGWVLLPLMDVISDPNIINSLVILARTSKSNKLHRKKETVTEVRFLENFIKGNNQKSSFATDLNTIKGNTELLYAFMQFLKKEEHVHLLQFCLDVDEFNNKLLTPDLSKQQMEELHLEALMVYKEYLKKDGPNFIGCPDDIVDDYYTLLKDGVYSIAKLRTSKPLYQAYEYTFIQLETVWLPSFFHSNEFYGHICGSKVTATYNKTAANRSLVSLSSPLKVRGRKYYETPISQGTVAKISSSLGKIRGALKAAQPIDGSFFPQDAQTIENGTVEDIIISECGNIFRDLSAWRISILSYQTTNKIVSFCINVQRLDLVNDSHKRHWVVLRKDQDFYTLKAKLVEFHGESEICDSPLPSRKAGSSIEIRMKKYEDFLTRLLQKPSLRGSDLLHTFLTAEEEFTVLIATSAQNSQDIGNIYQSVAHKLRKEKGQHLDSFMNTFLLSTGKMKAGKFEWAEIGDEVDLKTNALLDNPPIPKTFHNHVFNDNFEISYKVPEDSSFSSFTPLSIIHCIFYFLKYVFKVPRYILKLYLALCGVAEEAAEAFASFLIERKLKNSLSSTNLAYLVRLVDDAVFNPHIPPTKEELDERKKRAFKELENVFPTYVEKLFGNGVNDGFKTILEILQYPHYNKLLAYNLLDLILVEMYPSLQKDQVLHSS